MSLHCSLYRDCLIDELVLPIQFVKPLQHVSEGEEPRVLADDPEFDKAFFARRQQYIDLHKEIQPQNVFNLPEYWDKQERLDFCLTFAHVVSC